MALEGGEVNAGNVVHYLPVGLYSTTRAQQLRSRSTIPSYQFSRSHPSTRQLPPTPAWLLAPPNVWSCFSRGSRPSLFFFFRSRPASCVRGARTHSGRPVSGARRAGVRLAGTG